MGEGDGDCERDLSPDSARSGVRRAMPLPVLNFRCKTVLVLRVGRSSPSLDPRPREMEGDSPSVQCTLDSFPCLSCLCPRENEPDAFSEDVYPRSSVNGVVSVSGGENKPSGSR